MYIICKSSLHPMCLLILLHLTQKCSKLFSQFRHPALLFLVCLHSPYRTKLLIFHPVWYQHCFPPGCVPLVLLRFCTQIKTFSFYEQPHLSLPLSVTFLLYLQWRSHSTRNLLAVHHSHQKKKTKSFPGPKALKHPLPVSCLLSPDHHPVTCCHALGMHPQPITCLPHDPGTFWLSGPSHKPPASVAGLTDMLTSLRSSSKCHTFRGHHG